jgi:cobalt-zinc-cadmium efflux system outer membrane protein
MWKYLLSSVAPSVLLALTAAAQAPTAISPEGIAPLGDASLTALVTRTLAQHPRVLAAQAGVSASQALAQAADRPVFNPEIETDFARSDTSDRLIGFSQTLDWAGRRGARTSVAESERRVADELLAAARRDVTLELLRALAEVRSARALEDLALLRIDLTQRFATVAQQRRQAGDLTQVELNVANLAFAQAQIERASAASALATAQQNLRALTLQTTTDSMPRLPTDLPPLRVGEDDVTRLVAALPEVRARREQVAVAAAEVTLRDTERHASPTLTLSGGKEDGDSTLGLSFSMPLNVRNRFVYEVSAARATRAQAESALDNVMVVARARLEAATESYALTRAAWEGWLATGQPNLSEQSDLLERMWRAGELGVAEYLVQLNQTLDTQSSAVDLQRRLWLAWLDWLAAAGRIGAWLGLPMEG